MAGSAANSLPEQPRCECECEIPPSESSACSTTLAHSE
jgi:hypothetical protein